MKSISYLLGLMVISFWLLTSSAFADGSSKFLSKINSSNAILPVIPIKTEKIEVSGILYMPDLQQYLTVSDETPDDVLQLYLMDRFGRIAREIIIPGIAEINDMESITRDDNGVIYIASSSSVNNNGSIPDSRRLLITLRQNGADFIFDQRIDLLTALSECAAANSQEQWAGFITQAVTAGTLDIEGMFRLENALYLGFKSPFLDNHSIILRIDQVDQLMAQQPLTNEQISIWAQLDLINAEGEQEIITDLFYSNGTLFITSEPGENDSGDFSGSVWRFEPSTNNLARIVHYNDLKPEGIAAASDPAALLIGFDQGEGSNASSQTTLIRGVR